MGQAISRCSGWSNTSQPLPKPCPSRLEQLTVELKLAICDILSPASVAALSLTSKYLRAVLLYNNMIDQSLRVNGEQRIEFLGLLERDIGQRFFLCTRCAILRRFQSGCGPMQKHYRFWTCGCSHMEDTYGCSLPYLLSHHHVRLIINRHLYGPDHGLSLRDLEAGCVTPFFGGEEGWRQEWSARIINDELFLRVKHKIHGHHEQRLRQIIDTGFYLICNHTWLEAGHPEWPVALRTPSPGASDSDSLAGSVTEPLFTECEESHGSCGICLTDYTVNVRLRTSNHQAGSRDWEIAVTSYHQLGEGRSHSDWKWTLFAGKTNSPPMLEAGSDSHLAGTVMAQWLG